MKTSDIFKMCYQNLRRRKFRTLLTVIGVVIGTAAIISMISLGIGMNKSSNDLIASWGDLSVINIYHWYSEGTVLDDNVLTDISALDSVTAVSPFYTPTAFYNGKLRAGKNGRYEAQTWNIVGVYPEAIGAFGYTYREGEYPTAPSPKKLYVVFGSDVAYEFSDTKRAGRNSRVNPYPDEVTGIIPEPFINPMEEDDLTFVLEYYASNASDPKELIYETVVAGVLEGDDVNYMETRVNIYMDVKDVKKLAEDYKKAQKIKDPYGTQPEGYTNVKVKVSEIDKVTEVEKAIQDMGFETQSLESERQNALKESRNMQIILGGLGAVSLLVAAISIANTMIMSVSERTKEIGIMKVLGCFVENIRTIFLVESAMIGFLGGTVGIVISYIISFSINKFGALFEMMNSGALDYMSFFELFQQVLQMPSGQLSIIPLWLVLLGLFFSTFIGIAAGFYPASRAVKISALEAIRQD